MFPDSTNIESFIHHTIGSFIDGFEMAKVWRAIPTIEIRCCPEDFQKFVDGLITTRGGYPLSTSIDQDYQGNRSFRFIHSEVPIVFRERKAEVL